MIFSTLDKFHCNFIAKIVYLCLYELSMHGPKNGKRDSIQTAIEFEFRHYRLNALNKRNDYNQ